MSNFELFVVFSIMILFVADVISWLRQNHIEKECAEKVDEVQDWCERRIDRFDRPITGEPPIRRELIRLNDEVEMTKEKLARIVSRLQSALDDKAE